MIATLKLGRAIATSTPRMVITVTSSISVNPAWRFISPVLVDRAVQPSRFARGVDVEDVLAAPRRALRLVLITPESPGLAGHGVDRDLAEELQLLAGVSDLADALDQHFQAGGITLAAELDVGAPDPADVGGLLVL